MRSIVSARIRSGQPSTVGRPGPTTVGLPGRGTRAHTAPMRTGADAGVHAWQRSIVGWHLVFALLLVLTGGLVLAEGGGAVAVGLVLALGAWYAATGARAVNRDAPRLAVAYVA